MRLTRRSSSSISAAATPLLMICSAMMTLASVRRPGVPLEVKWRGWAGVFWRFG